MLFFETYKPYSQMLGNFISIVENDSSSLLYHTRVFDTFILDQISNFFYRTDIDMDISNVSSNNFLDYLFYYAELNSFFSFIFFNLFLETYGSFIDLFSSLNNRLFSTDLFFLYFKDFFFFLTIDYNSAIFNKFILLNQEGEFFTILNLSLDIFSEYMFYLDIFLYFTELFIILFLFIFLFNSMKNFFVTTKFYDNILTLFKQNNISFLEVTIVTTLYVSFLIFDTFVSFSEDDNFDTFFYLIFVFIIIMFFFLAVAIDIQYFFIMSNTSNGDVTLRLLFFDILNNFLSVLRIFLCWIRYIFYDIQVETIDFSFHYIDYSNETFLTSIFEENNYNDNLSNNFDISYSIIMQSYIYYLLFFFSDIVIILIQIMLSIFKLLIAFYLLWLIVDLFIMKVLAHSESLKFSNVRK